MSNARLHNLLSEEHSGRLFRFVLVGLISNACLLGLFAVLTLAGIEAVAAAMIVYGTGVGATYLINRSWTFRSRAPHPIAAPRYVAIHVLGAGTQAMIQFGGHYLLGVDAILIQALGMGFVAVQGFVLMKNFAFPKE